MCGEHLDGRGEVGHRTGSSPHVRGARAGSRGHDEDGGIIPACAGSTNSPIHQQAFRRDHPRMCGEHSASISRPRRSMGSSPHVRGALSSSPFRAFITGIIPACAGSTCFPRLRPIPKRDHPRMCGEHIASNKLYNRPSGSSPHVRGALERVHGRCRLRGIIPACAGSTSSSPSMLTILGDHPRMCGEHSRFT